MGVDSAVESGVNSAENSVDNGSEMCNLPRSSRASSERLTGRSDLSVSDIDIEMRTLNIQSHLSQSDPNIYQSSRQTSVVSKGEILESLQKRDSRSSLECQDSRSCSQSTQSTSTSAEFSLGNVNSVCDENLESPENVIDSQIGDQTFTNSVDAADSKDFSDEVDCTKDKSLENGSGEPGVHVEYTSSLPAANLPNLNLTSVASSTESWDEPCSNVASGSFAFDSLSDSRPMVEPEVTKRYFKAEYTKSEDGHGRSKSLLFILNLH